jgi:DNA-binding helix-hairpin-helix protein with protein kinase domain
MPRPTLYDSQGRALGLEAEIGKGGEGGVWQVADSPNRVAKLYHAPTEERSAKLNAMLALKTERLLKIAAWPIDTLHAGARGSVKGFLMPRAAGRQTHILYGPKSRLTGFPQATWPFLLTAAANLARAFAVVHEHGLIVGDVNHGNSLISDQATVVLIDCDSFQVTHGGRTFYCGVGVETHVPPELQGHDLSRVLRNRHHDAFGLATLVFQILFMGRHPFSGRFLGAGDMPIPQAIREFRFAYGSGAAGRQMQPPPNTLPLEAVSKEVALLFERAFSPHGIQEGARPAPQEWVGALEGLAKQLQVCSRNPSHHFLRSLAACPWCEIERRAGVLLFGFWVSAPAQQTGSFHLAAVWARTAAVAPPGAAPTLPDPKALRLQASPAALREGLWYWGKVILAVGSSLGATSLVLSPGNGPLAILLTVIAITSWLAREISSPERTRARQELKASEAELRRLHDLWQREASTAPFEAKLRELEQKRALYTDLPAARQRGLAQLQASRRQKQLERFLNRYRIEHRAIKGIGPARTATLQSYGIETAADIDAAAILRIPGFGPAMAQNLIHWRTSIEPTFVFDANRGIDPADLRALDNAFTSQGAQLERDLTAGATQLEQTRRWIEVRRQTLLSQITALNGRLAQAKADLRGF